jgi:hypothetical protein
MTLRILDYRYLRFIFNPIEDRFQLVHGWKDLSWNNIKSMRSGLDVDERDSRETVFGQNLIDIRQKSMGQLLVDEVNSVNFYTVKRIVHHLMLTVISIGPASVLHLPGCKFDPLVFGSILLLCCLHIHDLCQQYWRHYYRDAIGIY